MSHGDYAIVFVPGIRAKPRPEEHGAQLRRCVSAGVLKAGASPEEAAEIAESFDLVGWSHEFYGEHADISFDLPGIERLLADADSAAVDKAEASSLGRKILQFMYTLVELWPFLARHFSTGRMKSRVAEIDKARLAVRLRTISC